MSKREVIAQAGDTSPKPGAAQLTKATPWYSSPLALSLVSGVLLWAAFPPLNLGLLAWVAPLGWLALVRRENLSGRMPYAGVWVGGFLHWLVLLQFVRLPHWTAYFGWVALALYLSIYPLLFVGLSRVAVHRLRLPLLFAAPIIWTGLELLRGYLFTGFSVALLGHTQIVFPAMIQLADLFGAYGVSFVVMLGAACLASIWPAAKGKTAVSRRWNFWPAVPLACSVAAALGYGYYRLHETPPLASDGRVLKVALIQGCFPTRFDADYETGSRRARANFDDYLKQTEQVCKENPGLDLVVWPESMFTSTEPDIEMKGELQAPEGVDDAERYEAIVRSYAGAFEDKARFAAKKVNSAGGKWKLPGKTQLLVGCESQQLGAHRARRYNSALHISDEGKVVGRYFKMHRVMFGEYVPFGEWFPWLYTLTPMGEGLTAGESPRVFEVAGFRLAPSICFESTVPQVIRRQLRVLEEKESLPDLLVNVTNDGWFWGSNALDLHLTCGVFRAVEQRKPLLIAANTGFSAVVDGNGTVLQRGPRFAAGNLVGEVTADGRPSLYRLLGDLPGWCCALVVGLSAVVGGWSRVRRKW